MNAKIKRILLIIRKLIFYFDTEIFPNDELKGLLDMCENGTKTEQILALNKASLLIGTAAAVSARTAINAHSDINKRAARPKKLKTRPDNIAIMSSTDNTIAWMCLAICLSTLHLIINDEKDIDKKAIDWAMSTLIFVNDIFKKEVRDKK